MIIIRFLVFILGALLVLTTLMAAIRSFVLPRNTTEFLARLMFRTSRLFFDWLANKQPNFARKEQVLAHFAPVALIILLPYLLFFITIGYTAMFWATGMNDPFEAFVMSGSSLLTLGFAKSDSLIHMFLTFSEATIGLILVALLIAYLPTMYTAFSERELAVTPLAARAGTPPSSIEMILRMNRLGNLTNLDDFWAQWENWFGRLEESHTSLPALVFFRSPLPEFSWVTAAGAVLDTAALMLSTIDIPFSWQAAVCIRAGYLSLRRIADSFHVSYNANPSFPTEPISISREEFDAACAQLKAQNVPLKDDLEQAWLDFAGWRVNYDKVLLALCSITVAPPNTLWSSDRAPQNALKGYKLFPTK